MRTIGLLHDAVLEATTSLEQWEDMAAISKDPLTITKAIGYRDEWVVKLRLAKGDLASAEAQHDMQRQASKEKKKEHNLVEQVNAAMTDPRWADLQRETETMIDGVQGLQNWNNDKSLNSDGEPLERRLGGAEGRFSDISHAVTGTCSLIASIARQRQLKKKFWLEDFDQGKMGRGCQVRELCEDQMLMFQEKAGLPTTDRGEPELLTGLGVQISKKRYEALLQMYPETCRHDSFLYFGPERIAVFYTAEAGEHDDDTANTWHKLLQRWIGDELVPSSHSGTQLSLGTEDQLWYLVNCKPAAEALKPLIQERRKQQHQSANKNSSGGDALSRMLESHGTANTYMKINKIQWTADHRQLVNLYKVSLHLKTAARCEMNWTLPKRLALSWEYVINGERLWRL